MGISTRECYEAVVGRGLWPFYEGALRGRDTFKYKAEFEKNQWLSGQELREMQWQRLGKLLEHAYSTSEFYRESFDTAGLKPKDIHSPSDFIKLPIVEKSTVRQNIKQMVSSKYEIKELVKSATGGSTGDPMTLYYDWNSYHRRMSASMRGDSWAGWRFCGGEYYIWGVPLLPQSGFKRTKGLAYHAALRRYVVNSFDLGADKIEGFVHAFNKMKPRVVVGYTNAVYQFALHAKAAGLKMVPPKGVITSAEKLYPYQRDAIEDAFGARVFDRYGCREVMIIGAECDFHNGLHSTVDNLYIEIVKNGVPCEPGELGEVLLTDLHNYGMPLIRYKVGDVASWKGKDCPCGRGLPLLNVVEGRVFGLLTMPSGRIVSGALFPHLFKDFPVIENFKVIQEEKGFVQIKLATTGELDGDQFRLLKSTVQTTLGDDVKIEWLVGPDVEIERERKFNPVISRVPVDMGMSIVS